MNNISKIIKGHNKKVKSKPRDQNQNAIAEKKRECPMERICQVNSVVYKFEVTRPLPKKVYLGLAERE